MTTTERSVPKPEFTDAEAGAKVFPDSTARSFNYFTPQKRKPSHYEDVTVEVQPDPRHYLSQGWLYGFSDGRGGYPLDWTVLKAWGVDRPEPERFPGSGGKGYDWPAHGWHEFRDPNEEWELTLYRYNANVVRQINQNVETNRHPDCGVSDCAGSGDFLDAVFGAGVGNYTRDAWSWTAHYQTRSNGTYFDTSVDWPLNNRGDITWDLSHPRHGDHEDFS